MTCYTHPDCSSLLCAVFSPLLSLTSKLGDNTGTCNVPPPVRPPIVSVRGLCTCADAPAEEEVESGDCELARTNVGLPPSSFAWFACSTANSILTDVVSASSPDDDARGGRSERRSVLRTRLYRTG